MDFEIGISHMLALALILVFLCSCVILATAHV